MNTLKIKQEELKNEITDIFNSVSEITDKLRVDEKKYEAYFNNYLSCLEILKNKSELRGRFTSGESFINKLKREAEELDNVLKSISELIGGIVSEYENIETNLLFSAFTNISESITKTRDIVKELIYLFQYDDILTQSFLSNDEIMKAIKDIKAGEKRVNSGQLLKLKVLFSSIFVNIFDVYEETLYLIESKLIRMITVLKNSTNYIRAALEVVRNQNSLFFFSSDKLGKLEDELTEYFEKYEALVGFFNEMKPVISVADYSRLDGYKDKSEKVLKTLGAAKFNISVLMGKSALDAIIEGIEQVFEELNAIVDDSADDFDFKNYFIDQFKIKEHKEILLQIFGEEGEVVSECDIEFF